MKRTIHGFDGACTPERAYASQMTFSVGVFEILPKKNGKGTKRGKVKVRVSGYLSDPEAVKVRAREVCGQLDAGTYNGPKNVRVKP